MAKEPTSKFKPLTKPKTSAEVLTPTPEELQTLCFVCGANSRDAEGDEWGIAYTDDELLPTCPRCQALCVLTHDCGSDAEN